MLKRVMIVDDSHVARTVLRDILETGGHSVVAEAASGEEAIVKYRDTRPDVVFMDIVLPKKNGIETSREIIAMDKKAHIVIISVLDDAPLIKAAFTIGAKEYIRKPFDSAKVLKIVQDVSIMPHVEP